MVSADITIGLPMTLDDPPAVSVGEVSEGPCEIVIEVPPLSARSEAPALLARSGSPLRSARSGSPHFAARSEAPTLLARSGSPPRSARSGSPRAAARNSAPACPARGARPSRASSEAPLGARREAAGGGAPRFYMLLAELKAEYERATGGHAGNINAEWFDVGFSPSGPTRNSQEVVGRWRDTVTSLMASMRAPPVILRDCWEPGVNKHRMGIRHSMTDILAEGLHTFTSERSRTVQFETDCVATLWESSCSISVGEASDHVRGTIFSFRHSSQQWAVFCKSLAFPVHPDVLWRKYWALVGSLLLFVDFMLLTMSMFGSPDSVFAVDVFSIFYWSSDLFMNFFVGYFTSDGLYHTAPREIARRYMRSWFGFDTLVVVSSVASLIMEAGSESQGFGVLRLGRFVKNFRLLRLVNISASLCDAFQALHSERVRLFGRIVGCIVWMCLWVHLSAVGWYILGDRAGGWVHADDVPGEWHSLPMNYLMSVHYVSSQLQGSIDVFPGQTSAGERGFAVVQVLSSVILVALVVSRLTDAMQQLREATQRRRRFIANARGYMRLHGISAQLAVQVVRCVCKESAKSTDESYRAIESSLLQAVSPSLRREMLKEVHWPSLKKHLLFRAVVVKSPALRARLCSSVTVESYGHAELVFHFGARAGSMYILSHGSFEYRDGSGMFSLFQGARGRSSAREASPDDNLSTASSMGGLLSKPSSQLTGHTTDSMRATKTLQNKHDALTRRILRPGTTLGEVALWALWLHAGDLHAPASSRLARLAVTDFCEAVAAFPEVHQALVENANRMAKCMRNEGARVNDLFTSRCALEFVQNYNSTADDGMHNFASDGSAFFAGMQDGDVCTGSA